MGIVRPFFFFLNGIFFRTIVELLHVSFVEEYTSFAARGERCTRTYAAIAHRKVEQQFFHERYRDNGRAIVGVCTRVHVITARILMLPPGSFVSRFMNQRSEMQRMSKYRVLSFEQRKNLANTIRIKKKRGGEKKRKRSKKLSQFDDSSTRNITLSFVTRYA